MCAIIGALLGGVHSDRDVIDANGIINHIMRKSHERGRDGRGYISNSDVKNNCHINKSVTRYDESKACFNHSYIESPCRIYNMICNLRAEPTTEYVENKRKEDQQPYSLRGVQSSWSVVHNGTIANDKELRQKMRTKYNSKIDTAAIVEQLYHNCGSWKNHFDVFNHVMRQIKGSFAILATSEYDIDSIYIGLNYRPVWYIKTPYGFFFASSRDYFPEEYTPVMLDPYSVYHFNDYDGEITFYKHPLLENKQTKRVLAVCSGGLDSVVAATYCKKVLKADVELINFQYGSRAEDPEIKAINAVAEALDVPVTLFPMAVYKPGDSPLLDANSTIAGGEEGAEFAFEWVPARNLVMLALATAYAEANGFDTIMLGNNLEEAGSYPDNEPEFIARFGDLLPFAVGDGKRVEIIQPVGNLMKHEIVALGHEIGAPLDKTWSCYRAGDRHCGKCGPCFMRKTAFKINNLSEVIEYDA